MPQLDYDYDYGYSGNLARKPKKKAVFDQDAAVSLMRKPTERDFYEAKYADDFKKVDERFAQIRKQSFDYDLEAKKGTKRVYKQKPEEIAPEDVEEVEEYIDEEEIEEKRARKQKREIAVKRFKDIVLYMLIAVVALFVVYRYSLINEKFNEVEKVKRQLANAQTVNEQIQADIDSETDISYIENFAKYQLGMQKPQDSQTVYVNIEKKDKIFTPVSFEEDAEEQTWFGEIVQKLANIFD